MICSAPTSCHLDPIEVPPHRLGSGYWCHRRDKMRERGDIHAAYSADLIAGDGRVRQPFSWQGQWYVTTSMHYHPAPAATAYVLVPASYFQGTPTTYREKGARNGGEDARRDPLGFYHGMLVRRGGKDHVLLGPPRQFNEGPPQPEQAELF